MANKNLKTILGIAGGIGAAAVAVAVGLLCGKKRDNNEGAAIEAEYEECNEECEDETDGE